MSDLEVTEELQDNAPPSYINDVRMRDRVLDEANVIDALQREIFHKICAEWEPIINYDHFIKRIECENVGKKETACIQLIERLQQCHLAAVLVTTMKTNDLEPAQHVIRFSICDQDSFNFYGTYLYNLILAQDATPGGTAFPEKTELEKRDIERLVVPEKYIKTLPLDRLSPNTINRLANNKAIYSITITNKVILCPAHALNELIESCRTILSHVLTDLKNDKNQKFATALAKTSGMDTASFRKKLMIVSPPWPEITQTINNYIKDCASTKTPVEKVHSSVWIASALLFHFEKNSAHENEEDAQKVHRMKLDFEVIEGDIRNHEELLVPYSYLEEKLEEFHPVYKDQFNYFLDEFNRIKVDTGERKAKTRITSGTVKALHVIDGIYVVLQDKLVHACLQLLATTREQLLPFFSAQMREFINNPTAKHPFLNNRKNFLEALKAQVIEQQPALYGLLNNHIDALLISAESRDSELGGDKLVSALFSIKDDDTKYTIRPFDELLSLSMAELYAIEYGRVNPVVRLVMGIFTRRFQSLEEKFAQLSPGYTLLKSKGVKVGADAVHTIHSASAGKTQSAEERYRERQARRSNKRGHQKSNAKSEHVAAPLVTEADVDSAAKQFKETLKTASRRESAEKKAKDRDDRTIH